MEFDKSKKSKNSKKEKCLANPNSQWVLKKSKCKGGRKSGYCRLRSMAPKNHPKQDCMSASKKWVKRAGRGYCRSVSMSPRKHPKKDCEIASKKWVKRSCGRKGYCKSPAKNITPA